jgi:GNAT superfamily N-acetyltransferase
VDTPFDIAEVDPLDPDNQPLLNAMYDVSSAARAERPFEVWAPWSTTYRTWTTPSPDEQTDVLWAARSGDQVVGMATSHLPLLDNQHTADVTLFVHPDHQRRGVGSRLLDTVAEHARTAGRTVLMTSPCSPVDREGAGEKFLSARGFELGIAEVQQVCDVEASEPAWGALAAEAASHHADYRLEAWEDRIPEALVEGYCQMGEAFNHEVPLGELEIEPEVWSAERVRRRDDRFLATGRHQFGVLAYAADGTCVGTTELFVNEVAAWRALQGGTLVVPGHRGHQLGLAMKAANLAAVRRRFAECRYVFTAVADVNGPMNSVNAALGFRPVERLLEMQRRL